MLLDAASDDLVDPDQIRRLLKELREVRMAKIRSGVDVLDAAATGGGGVALTGVGAMEIGESRGFVTGVVDGLRYGGHTNWFWGDSNQLTPCLGRLVRRKNKPDGSRWRKRWPMGDMMPPRTMKTRWSSKALSLVRFFLHYGVMERTHTAQAIAIERVSNVYIPYIFQAIANNLPPTNTIKMHAQTAETRTNCSQETACIEPIGPNLAEWKSKKKWYNVPLA